jgi:arsenate reductase
MKRASTCRVRVYDYKSCSTCQKARKFLDGAGAAVEHVDITTTPPTETELEAMLARYDGDVRKLFNTSGLAYRTGKVAEKLARLSPREALQLLAGNGRLVKRPFLVVDEAPVAVGFKEAEWAELL